MNFFFHFFVDKSVRNLSSGLEQILKIQHFVHLKQNTLFRYIRYLKYILELAGDQDLLFDTISSCQVS